MKAIIGGALMVLTITTAHADEDRRSGNYVLRYCKPHLDFGYGRCMGMIEAVTDLMRDDDLKPIGGTVCMSEHVTRQQMVQVVVKYIEAHPENMHQPFVGLAMVALYKAWPCKP